MRFPSLHYFPSLFWPKFRIIPFPSLSSTTFYVALLLYFTLLSLLIFLRFLLPFSFFPFFFSSCTFICFASFLLETFTFFSFFT